MYDITNTKIEWQLKKYIHEMYIYYILIISIVVIYHLLTRLSLMHICVCANNNIKYNNILSSFWYCLPIWLNMHIAHNNIILHYMMHELMQSYLT